MYLYAKVKQEAEALAQPDPVEETPVEETPVEEEKGEEEQNDAETSHGDDEDPHVVLFSIKLSEMAKHKGKHAELMKDIEANIAKSKGIDPNRVIVKEIKELPPTFPANHQGEGEGEVARGDEETKAGEGGVEVQKLDEEKAETEKRGEDAGEGEEVAVTDGSEGQSEDNKEGERESDADAVPDKTPDVVLNVEVKGFADAEDAKAFASEAAKGDPLDLDEYGEHRPEFVLGKEPVAHSWHAALGVFKALHKFKAGHGHVELDHADEADHEENASSEPVEEIEQPEDDEKFMEVTFTLRFGIDKPELDVDKFRTDKELQSQLMNSVGTLKWVLLQDAPDRALPPNPL